MKRIIYSSFAVALVALSSCSDELVENPAAPAQTGDEITFGSSLTDVQTRTIYGEDPVNGAYPVYWEDGDQISIYCPEAAQGNLVSYKITPNELDATTSSAVTKVNADQAGLQWGQQETHHFSAIYPADKITGVQDGTLTASIPVDQTPTEWKYDETTKTWTGIASTDYAYMWAYGTHNKSEGGDVALEFHPWVTILDVEITGPESGQMKMSSVQIRSNDYETLNGEFQIDFKPVETGGDAPVYVQAGNPNATRSQISIQLYDPKYYEHKPAAGKTGGDFITLEQGEKIVVRFYLLPKDDGYNTSEDAQGRSDLQIRVAPYNMAVLTRTLTSQDGHEDAGKGGILPHKVNRVILPPVNNAGVNYWMSSLNPNIYVTELSLPGSKFSYQNATDFSNVRQVYQSLSIADQFKNGIRAFHVQTCGINDGGNTSWNPADMRLYVTVDGKRTSKKITDMVKTVADGLAEAEQVGKKTGEYAFILLTYSSGGEGHGIWPNDTPEAEAWMEAVQNELTDMAKDAQYRLYTDEITPNTTIGDVAGKIIVKVNYNDDKMANTLARDAQLPALFSIWGYGSQSNTSEGLPSTEEAHCNAYAMNNLRWGTSNHNAPVNMTFFYHEASSIGHNDNGGEETETEKKTRMEDMWERSIRYYSSNDNHDMWFMNDLGGYYINGGYDGSESQRGINGWTQEIGPLATQYLQGRNADATLGIVLMNYADPNNQYSGNLIQSIINNNFLFQLRTAGEAQADSFDATYQNGGNAIGWQ